MLTVVSETLQQFTSEVHLALKSTTVKSDNTNGGFFFLLKQTKNMTKPVLKKINLKHPVRLYPTIHVLFLFFQQMRS